MRRTINVNIDMIVDMIGVVMEAIVAVAEAVTVAVGEVQVRW